MNTRSWTLVVVLMAAFLLASISVVYAEPASPGAVACVLNITYDDYADGTYWKGRVEECELAGSIRFFAVFEQYACHGNTMHFVEDFVLNPDAGGEIHGRNFGVWNLKTAKFRAHGWVTASEEYPELVGSHYQEMGTTSTTDVTVRPITASDGKMILAPGNRALENLQPNPASPCS